MRIYSIGVSCNRGLYETIKMSKKDTKDFIELLRSIDKDFYVSKYNNEGNTWEDCISEFPEIKIKTYNTEAK